MTDPDFQSFRAAQSAHSQELRSVRILEKTLGCTRSEARVLVQRTAAQRALNQNLTPNAGSRATPLFQPPPVQRREVVLPAVPAAAVGALDAGIPVAPMLPQPPPILPSTANCVVVVSGVLYTVDVYIDLATLTIVT